MTACKPSSFATEKLQPAAMTVGSCLDTDTCGKPSSGLEEIEQPLAPRSVHYFLVIAEA